MSEIARVVFDMPCGIMITGLPRQALADSGHHRGRCKLCIGVKDLNAINVYDDVLVKREFPSERRDARGERNIINRIMFHSGSIPCRTILEQIISGDIAKDKIQSGVLRLENW
jgi:hypothetical protein